MHALQDQHYGLEVGRNDLGEDDAELARHAVYEGDATLAGFAVVMGSLGRRSAVSLAGQLEGVPGALAQAYPEIPAAIRETVAFEYVAGVNFVSWAYERAGWDGVGRGGTRSPRGAPGARAGVRSGGRSARSRRAYTRDRDAVTDLI